MCGGEKSIGQKKGQDLNVSDFGRKNLADAFWKGSLVGSKFGEGKGLRANPKPESYPSVRGMILYSITGGLGKR